MAEFEQACQDKGLALFVLPPKRPDLNGAVERAQSSWRYAFYACHDLPHRLERLNEHIDAFAHLCKPSSPAWGSCWPNARRAPHCSPSWTRPAVSYVPTPDTSWTSCKGNAYKRPLRLVGATRPGSSVGRARD